MAGRNWVGVSEQTKSGCQNKTRKPGEGEHLAWDTCQLDGIIHGFLCGIRGVEKVGVALGLTVKLPCQVMRQEKFCIKSHDQRSHDQWWSVEEKFCKIYSILADFDWFWGDLRPENGGLWTKTWCCHFLQHNWWHWKVWWVEKSNLFSGSPVLCSRQSSS